MDVYGNTQAEKKPRLNKPQNISILCVLFTVLSSVPTTVPGI